MWAFLRTLFHTTRLLSTPRVSARTRVNVPIIEGACGTIPGPVSLSAAWMCMSLCQMLSPVMLSPPNDIITSLQPLPRVKRREILG